ncbi:MAG: peptide chain release factor N(5)-glutamine methyltransferase [Planctomycetes bacterium]|nr:peptide chain release factor N(5)-glutamine methyltransferase [Planctomycetota bacterium]
MSGTSGTSTTQSEPWTILRLLQWTTEHLKKNGSPSPRLDAEVLLAEARGCQRIDLYAAFNEEPPESVKAIFRDSIKRRAAGEPVAYIVGKKEFFSLPFHVTAACLIPRGETEHVVIECLDRLKKYQRIDDTVSQPSVSQPMGIRIVDVCTGSGCIAITIAKESAKFGANIEVIAIDLSPDALAIAAENVRRLEVSDVVSLVEGDLLTSIPDRSVDFVVSNPPYVSETELLQSDRGVRDYEPKMALVSGPTGLEIVERLIDQSAGKLFPGGWLIFELSPMIAERSLGMLQNDPRWKQCGLVNDLAGKKRVAIAQRAT